MFDSADGHSDDTSSGLKRLGTDHIDLLQLHGQDYNTSIDETLATLDQLVRAGKVRYIGASNFSGGHLMKSLATSDRRVRRHLRPARPATSRVLRTAVTVIRKE